MATPTPAPVTDLPVVAVPESNSQAMVFVAGATSGMLLGMCTCVFIYLAYRYYKLKYPLGSGEAQSRDSLDLEMSPHGSAQHSYGQPDGHHPGLGSSVVNGGYHTPSPHHYQPPKIPPAFPPSEPGSPVGRRDHHGRPGKSSMHSCHSAYSAASGLGHPASPLGPSASMSTAMDGGAHFGGHYSTASGQDPSVASNGHDVVHGAHGYVLPSPHASCLPPYPHNLHGGVGGPGGKLSHSTGAIQFAASPTQGAAAMHQQQQQPGSNGQQTPLAAPIRDGSVSFRAEFPGGVNPPSDVGMARRESGLDNSAKLSHSGCGAAGDRDLSPLSQTQGAGTSAGGSFAQKRVSSSPRQSISRRRAATVFQGWRKGRSLGSGMSGQVFLGVKADGSLMAVKVLDITSIPDQKGIASLCNEIDILAKFSHENIVDYHGYHLDDERKELHIFMEYVSNGSLGQLVRSMEQPLAEEAVAKYTAQILQGIAYLHCNQIMHRDIKGDNILMHQDNTIKISDFGMSKSIGETIKNGGAQSYQCGGTPLWSAPEVFKSNTYDLKSDIWSVGCVVVELLTGRPPWQQFDSVWAAISTIGKCTTFPPLMPKVSEVCQDFLEKCLDPECEKRLPASDLIVHEWILSAEDCGDDDTECSGLSSHDDEAYKGQLFRKISEIHTPVASNASRMFPNNRRPKGRLSSAAQLQYASMNLGDPQLPVSSPNTSPVAGLRPRPRTPPSPASETSSSSA